MFTLAAFRYRNALAEYGGPIASIEMGKFPVRGRQLMLANASLNEGLAHRGPLSLFSATADGTGVHEVAAVARHIAISEALERWAFNTLVRSDRAADYGFHLDPTTTGMAAFPGLLHRQSRRRSVLEAVERYCLMSWWEGCAEGRSFDTDWPGISAVAIDGPFGGVTVIVYGQTSWGGYVYGHAADESFTGACERAIVELARHEWALRSWWLARLAGERKQPTNIFERRMLHFTTPEGFAQFRSRLSKPAWRTAPGREVICDAELPGPWSDYATVWRFALRPVSEMYLQNREDYFFL